jgi:hypothetical protein
VSRRVVQTLFGGLRFVAHGQQKAADLNDSPRYRLSPEAFGILQLLLLLNQGCWSAASFGNLARTEARRTAPSARARHTQLDGARGPH